MASCGSTISHHYDTNLGQGLGILVSTDILGMKPHVGLLPSYFFISIYFNKDIQNMKEKLRGT